ncbi:endonuclease [Fluoribacter dumoffii]|uniref:Extracellular deoxyribonuclease n=1 Tax=Fluoribacter dumoffii TaxID=463 RepID=A0A377G904_9GAMM|nr:endonuclease [Fluoribacter dumoffii]KTC90177.1 putative endonuclease-1 [Fluoribacter dumoffii NY 23]MCW8385472.1 endonuclease [Fluoribacter dumoffii]MCW8418523.1 endonuclease [Fluoribacter dumoffii]MCW8453635.1 endonuclease [Fluoribacter dumoffii]MCW8459147.1 endonuclease [Fluoribacter dumoffii]
MLWFIFLLCIISSSYAHTPSLISQWKKNASEPEKLLPVYLSYENKKRSLAGCDMGNTTFLPGVYETKWSHNFSGAHFGQQFACWSTSLYLDNQCMSFKRRKYCERFNEQFGYVEADFYNLWPEIGIENQTYPNELGVLTQGRDCFGCVNKNDKSHLEPTDSVKGVIARTYLFMNEHYGLSLSPSQKKLFIAWNKAFKPQAWEKQWALQVALIEGYKDSYITHWQVKAHVAL